MGHWGWLDSGLGFHDLHSHGGCHQDHSLWWAAHRGGWISHMLAGSVSVSCFKYDWLCVLSISKLQLEAVKRFLFRVADKLGLGREAKSHSANEHSSVWNAFNVKVYEQFCFRPNIVCQMFVLSRCSQCCVTACTVASFDPFHDQLLLIILSACSQSNNWVRTSRWLCQ